MLLVARDKIVCARGHGALQDAIVVVLGGHQGDPLHRFDEGRHASDEVHPLVRLPPGKSELVAQDSFELVQNKVGRLLPPGMDEPGDILLVP